MAQEIVEQIKDIIGPRYLADCTVELKPIQGLGAYSILISSKSSSYRSKATENMTLANLKTAGKSTYISFSARYAPLFDRAHIPYTPAGSQPNPTIRVGFDVFSPLLCDESAVLSSVLQEIFINLFSLSPFNCCSRYMQCSDAKECVHPDLIYALSCGYGRHLKNGTVFYGANRNV